MNHGHGRFEDALFQQTKQLRFLESDRGKHYLAAFEADYRDKRKEAAHPPTGMLYHLVTETVRRADPIYVSPDVTEIIDDARKDFAPEPIIASDPFVPCGFAYFPRSIKVRDRRGTEQGVRAIGWVPITKGGRADFDLGDPEWIGMWVSWFSHETDANGHDESMTPERWHELHPLAELQLLHSCYVPFEEAGWERVGDSDGVTYEGSITEQWILPQVMWRIGQQIVPAPERPARNHRRDAMRHGLLQDEVSVLRLRRTNPNYDGPEDEGEGKYDHRWLVRGHWRQQWMPSLGHHRQVWISAYVKGPEGKPLIIKDRAVEFTR